MSNVIEFDGIGTHWWVELWTKDGEQRSTRLDEKIKKIVQKFETDYSRFKDDSLIGQLNTNKVLHNPPQELLDIINAALKFTELSDGIFNIGIAQVLENIGYDRDYSLNINEGATSTSRLHDKFLEIKNDILKIPSDIKIDLGGIGKGWLIDKLADFLKAEGVESFVINGGGDIYATHEDNKPIRFALENPFNYEEAIGHIDIKNSSIASSSPNRRSWVDKKSGKKLHHLINTKDISDFSSAKVATYVHAKTATLADVASTILFLSDDFETMAKKLDVEYLVVFENGSYKKSSAYKAELFG